MKSGNLNFLEPTGPLQACNGIALPIISQYLPLCYSCLQYSVQLHAVQFCSLEAIGYTIQPRCVAGYTVLPRFMWVHCMTSAQRRNRLTTHFSECIPVVKRRISVISGANLLTRWLGFMHPCPSKAHPCSLITILTFRRLTTTIVVVPHR